VTRAEEIRRRQLHTLTVGGQEYTFRRPGSKDLALAQHRITFIDAEDNLAEARAAAEDPAAFLAKFGGDIEKIVEDLAPELTFLGRIVVACSVDPLIIDVPVEECPEDRVCLDMIPDEWPSLGRMRMALVPVKEAQAAAKAAGDFREDGGGAADRADMPVLQGAPEPVAPAEPG
jgi:hypothetical protein